MYLFFDGVSSNGYIGLFDSDKNIVNFDNFRVVGNESTKVIPIIDNFLKKNNIKYEDVQNIITVVGPGSFTGIRSITLVVNTLSFIYPNISLTPVNFFELYDTYPIVKSSSKRDLFVKYEESATIEIVKNEDFVLPHGRKILYGDTDISRFSKDICLESQIDYATIFQDIIIENNKNVSPLYIKKPNIS